MPAEAWQGFLHSWHTLGIVLKWMCITVVGIPAAVATCVVVASAVVIFGLLCLAAAAGALAIVFYIFKGLWWSVRRVPSCVEKSKIRYAERKLGGLPLANARVREMEQWAGKQAAVQRPLEAVPPGYWPTAGTLQSPPPRAHLPRSTRRSSASSASTLSVLPALDVDCPELPPGRFGCKVCMESKDLAEFPSRTPTTTCEHEATQCCTECLSVSIAMGFQGNMWYNVRCPICGEQLEHHDVAEHGSPVVFERYDNLSLRRTLENDIPNFRWCLGPNCTFGQEHPESSTDQAMVVCSSCGFVTCAHHDMPWHAEETCEEYDRRVEAVVGVVDKTSEKIISRIAKRCPGCRRFINKDGGCPHMTCVCGKEFCWNCSHEYPGHSWGCIRRS